MVSSSNSWDSHGSRAARKVEKVDEIDGLGVLVSGEEMVGIHVSPWMLLCANAGRHAGGSGQETSDKGG